MDLEHFWGPEYPAIIMDPTPPSAGRVHAWEVRHGVKLPTTLAKALAVQDGGCVRGTALIIYPLSEIVPLGGNRFQFGADDDRQAQLLLAYAGDNEPQILCAPHESHEQSEATLEAASFDNLLRILLTSSQ